MWLLKFLPDWIFYTILLSGFVGLVTSKFVPIYYRTAVQSLSVGLLVVGIFMAGAIHDNAAWQERVNDLEKKSLKLKQSQAKRM